MVNTSSFGAFRRLSSAVQCRRFINMGRIVPEIDIELEEKIADGSINPKLLNTRRNIGMVYLPARLQAIAERRIAEFSDKTFRFEARYLMSVLSDYKLPDDKQTLATRKADIKTRLEVRDKTIEDAYYDPKNLKLEEDQDIARDRLSQMILGTLDEQRRDWHYFDYDQYASHLYMAARLAPNYSCIRSVIKDINQSDPSFKPRSVLDFGSGMGTTYWAVEDAWPESVSEYMNIEISKEQQYLAEYLIRGGHDRGVTPGIFHKQYLPSSDKVKYDMVVAAFSMLELPTRELRANVIENLWHKTNDLLVIIERGNRGGFATVNDARHFVLDLSGHDVTKKINFTTESRPILKNQVPDCHVLAPCAHEFACPRAQMSTKKNMDICRFRTFFMPLLIGDQRPSYLREDFSYVVLRKRPHPSYLDSGCKIRYPRIVEKRHKASGQVSFKLCCPNGALASSVTTKAKGGKSLYSLAKACDWGDILPVKVCDTYVKKVNRLIADK